MKVVSRVLHTHSQSVADDGVSAFVPLVAIEPLPSGDRERAKNVYADVAREAAAEVAQATEEKWGAYQSKLGFSLSEELASGLKSAWLVREYVEIVAGVVGVPRELGADSYCRAHGNSPTAHSDLPVDSVRPAGVSGDAGTLRRKIRRGSLAPPKDLGIPDEAPEKRRRTGFLGGGTCDRFRE